MISAKKNKSAFLHILLLFFVTLTSTSCSKSQEEEIMTKEISVATTGLASTDVRAPIFVKGADISWLSQMEQSGIKFYYADGQEGDCMKILKSLGMNTFRFRVWVNPTSKWNGTQDVVDKCIRAQEIGMDVMINFHYSDSWADPSKQNIPKEWEGLDLAGLTKKVSEYTRGVLSELKSNGVNVKWVQIGNETGNGVLWPYGQADKNPKGYAELNNAGYYAVKDVFPEAKVIVHIQNGQDSGLAKWLFGLLHNNGGKFDVAGFSLYPEPGNYAQYVNSARNTMQQCITSYNCDVMLCEVGMGNSYVKECEDFLNLCFKLSEEIDNNRMLGVLYWEPQVYNDWQGYRKGCFTSAGRPSSALDAFKYIDSKVQVVLPD